MVMPLQPYRQSGIAGAIESLGQLLPLVLGMHKIKEMHDMKAKPLGSVLGYDPTQEGVSTVPAPGPVANYGPSTTVARTAQDPSGMVTPDVKTVFKGAPAAMQPMLSTPMGNIMKLREMLGDTQMTNIMGGMGINKSGTGGSTLEWDPTTNTFTLPQNPSGGPQRVDLKTASLLMRQMGIQSQMASLEQRKQRSKDIENWRSKTYELATKKFGNSEVGKAVQTAISNLALIGSPAFQEMDETVQQQLMASIPMHYKILQENGLKVYNFAKDNNRTPTPKPAATPTAPRPQGSDLKTKRLQRYGEIKSQNPGMTDQQIAAQIAIEEQSDEAGG